MPPKREDIVSVRFSAEESLCLRTAAYRLNLSVADMVRKCLALGLPTLEGVEFTRRVQLEDCKFFGINQQNN